MKASELRIGDRIKIVAMPGADVPGYVLQDETRRVFKKLIVRSQPVRIFMIDEYGAPWYRCRFRRKNGGWKEHWLAVFDGEENWVVVKPRSRTVPTASLQRSKNRSKPTR
jgi:hypothetical protein